MIAKLGSRPKQADGIHYDIQLQELLRKLIENRSSPGPHNYAMPFPLLILLDETTELYLYP